jgi:hypothetical protein
VREYENTGIREYGNTRVRDSEEKDRATTRPRDQRTTEEADNGSMGIREVALSRVHFFLGLPKPLEDTIELNLWTRLRPETGDRRPSVPSPVLLREGAERLRTPLVCPTEPRRRRGVFFSILRRVPSKWNSRSGLHLSYLH